MRTFAPKGNVFGPIMPMYIFKRGISQGAKVMYAYLCNLASYSDHCWPNNKTIAQEIDSCENSVKNYMKELADEKLIEIRIECNRRKIYILLPENPSCGLRIQFPDNKDELQRKQDKSKNFSQCKSNSGYGQPNFENHKPKFGHVNNINKKSEEIKNTPPLPPKASTHDRQNFCQRAVPPAAGRVSIFYSDFESIWELYPKKRAKGDAFAQWQAMQSANALPEVKVILDAIKRLKQSNAWQMEDGRFVPQLAKWLYGMGWLDQLTENENREIARLEAYRKAKEAEEKQEREFQAKRQAWLNSIRPAFDELAAKFSRISNRAEAFAIWTNMYTNGKAPTATDVPDDNASDLVYFLLTYRARMRDQKSDQSRSSTPEAVRDTRTFQHCSEILEMLRNRQGPVPQSRFKSNHVAA